MQLKINARAWQKDPKTGLRFTYAQVSFEGIGVVVNDLCVRQNADDTYNVTSSPRRFMAKARTADGKEVMIEKTSFPVSLAPETREEIVKAVLA